jgi:hypothetical protein
VLGLLLACAAACSPTAADAPMEDQWRHIELKAAPVELGAAQTGALKFRGGLWLTSTDEQFGGFSGLEVLEDGQLVAVSDRGRWLSARIRLDADGTLVGLDEARLAPLRDERGELFRRRQDVDSEGLTQLADGRFAVSFEQSQSIRIYDLNRDGPFGEAAPGPALADTAQLAPNVGLEALATAADGALIAGAERGWEADTRIWRAPLRSPEAAPPGAHYPLEFGFALVGLDRLPDDDFVALERFFAPAIGAKIRVARVAAADLEAPGCVVRKTELALFEAPLALDNFESVSAVRAPDGGVRLYIVSDDNFSTAQRTLLYAFDLVEGAAPKGVEVDGATH